LKANKKEEGFALVTVLLFVLIILLIGTAAIALANNDVLISAKHKEEMQAFYAAEAGLTDAVEKVKKGGAIPPPPSPPLEEIVSGIVSDPPGSNPSYPAAYEVVSIKEGEKIRLNSTGYVGSKSDYQAKAAVSALFSYKLQPAFEYAFFGPTLNLGKTTGLEGNFYVENELVISSNTQNLAGTIYFRGQKEDIADHIPPSWTVAESEDEDILILEKGNDKIRIELISDLIPMPEVDIEAFKKRAEDDNTFYNGDGTYSSPTNLDFTQNPLRFIEGNLTINIKKNESITFQGTGAIVATGTITIAGENEGTNKNIQLEEGSQGSLVFISLHDSTDSTDPAITIDNIDLFQAVAFAPYGKIALGQDSNSGMIIQGSLVGEEVDMTDSHNIEISYNPRNYFTNGIPPGIGQWQMEKWEQLP